MTWFPMDVDLEGVGNMEFVAADTVRKRNQHGSFCVFFFN